MRPVIVYFISGDIDGEHIVSLEEALKEMFPNRTTNIFFVENEDQKDLALEIYNIEELKPELVDVLWKNAETT